VGRKSLDRKFNLLNWNIDSVAGIVRNVHEDVSKKLNDIQKVVNTLPRSSGNRAVTQNIIHLGLKDGRATTDLVPVALAIRPEDFQVNANLLYDALLYQMEEVGKRQKNCPDTWACCIIQNSGIQRLLDNQSFLDAWQALIRLLINGDKEATLRFLRTLADSVANVTAPAIEPTPAK
jgi:hypothetical protein